MAGAQSLVGELRVHKLHAVRKKKKVALKSKCLCFMIFQPDIQGKVKSSVSYI